MIQQLAWLDQASVKIRMAAFLSKQVSHGFQPRLPFGNSHEMSINIVPKGGESTEADYGNG